MKLNKSQREVLDKQFQASFNDIMLEEAFKREYNEAYRKMGSEFLQQQGFPKYVDVDKENVLDVVITPKSDTNVFVDYIENANVIESAEEFEAVRNDAEFFIEIILNNINQTKIVFRAKASPEEFLDRYPTESYLAKSMASSFSKSEIETRLKESNEFKEEVKIAASEEGFGNNVKLTNKDYRIEDVRPKVSYDSLAERVLDSGYFNSSETVKSFIANQFHKLLIQQRLVDYTIRITKDPQDQEEE